MMLEELNDTGMLVLNLYEMEIVIEMKSRSLALILYLICPTQEISGANRDISYAW